MEKVKFIIKAKSDSLDIFRRAFDDMNAVVSEVWADKEKAVMKFTVECDAKNLFILENTVPVSAYASVAFASGRKV